MIYYPDFIESLKSFTRVRLLIYTPLSDVENDVLAILDPLIPIAPAIYFGEHKKEKSLKFQMQQANVEKGEILLLISGGGDTNTERFSCIRKKFDADLCSYIRNVLQAHLGVAIGHNQPKYKMPVDDLCDFLKQTPSQLGLLVNEMWGKVCADPEVYEKYARAFNSDTSKSNIPYIANKQLLLPIENYERKGII
jgi:hypothetical protein